MRGIVCKTAVIIISAVVLAGCGSRINQENYNRLEVGMKYEQVVGLLGEPDNCNSAMMANNCIWGSEKRYINVKFVDGQVVLFSSKGI